ncbi:hypothetical protein C2E31_23255 [Rhodopirellula baltica]|nr:hypothetical protein C2E31_23255 [Rhodopirellula baltica]
MKVIVRDGETAAEAFGRLQRIVQRQNGRPSHKRRYGYYEKPSELKRKRKKKRAVRPGMPLHVHPYSALFSRSGPKNSLMR